MERWEKGSSDGEKTWQWGEAGFPSFPPPLVPQSQGNVPLKRASPFASSLDTLAKDDCWCDAGPWDLFQAAAWIKQPKVYTWFQILSSFNFTFLSPSAATHKLRLVRCCCTGALYRVGSLQLGVERINWKANQIYNEIFLKSLKEGLLHKPLLLKILFHHSASSLVYISQKLKATPCPTLQMPKSIYVFDYMGSVIIFLSPIRTSFLSFAYQKIFPTVVLCCLKKKETISK